MPDEQSRVSPVFSSKHLCMRPLSLLLCCFLFLCMPGAFAQSAWQKANEQRIHANKINMYVLGGWAAGNLIFSGIRRAQTTGETRYFHEMNVAWNLVNLGLAGGGLYGAYTEKPEGYSFAQTYQEQQKIEKILLFNCALNFTYMTAGAWLRERSKTATNNPARLRGYGNSLILQGAFLLAFDATQIVIHQQTGGKTLKGLLPQMQYIGNGVGLSWWLP